MTANFMLFYDRIDDAYRYDQAPPSIQPKRYDFCRVVFSGEVGSIPKEFFLPNKHFKVTFDLALTGHFSALFDREKYKPTETTRIPSEVWDDIAKHNHKLLQKGGRLQAVGVLKTDHWIDKHSGEERSRNVMRITKLLSDEEFLQLAYILNDIDAPSKGDAMSDNFDSGFSSDFPDLDDHFENDQRRYDDKAAVAPTSNNLSNGHRKPLNRLMKLGSESVVSQQMGRRSSSNRFRIVNPPPLQDENNHDDDVHGHNDDDHGNDGALKTG